MKLWRKRSTTEFGAAHASFNVVIITVLFGVAAASRTLASLFISLSYNIYEISNQNKHTQILALNLLESSKRVTHTFWILVGRNKTKRDLDEKL